MRSVARAAVGRSTAYLHTCVSILAGHGGGFDEARRHRDIAVSLLDVYRNTCSEAPSLVNRGCIGCLHCDFDTPTRILSPASQIAEKSGHGYLALAAKGSLGHVLLTVGQFDKAKETLSTVVNDERVAVAWKLGAADSLSRVHLALGELDQCEQILDTMSQQIEQHSQTAPIYHVRWSSITQARLKMRRGLIDPALSIARSTDERAVFLGDKPLAAIAKVIAAQASALNNNPRESARLLLDAS